MRRPLLLLAVVVGLRGRVARRHRGPARRARPRPAGRRRGRPRRASRPRPAQVTPEAIDRSVEIIREPRRRVRRRRARDPDAGRRPDRGRAAGRGQPGAGRQRPDPAGAARLHQLRAQRRRTRSRQQTLYDGGHSSPSSTTPESGARPADLLRVRQGDEAADRRVPPAGPGVAAGELPERHDPARTSRCWRCRRASSSPRGDQTPPDPRRRHADDLATSSRTTPA